MASTGSGGGIDYRAIYFAFPNVTHIDGEPDADNLIKLKNQVKANASSVPSNLGGGAHGHLGLVTSTTTYALLSNTPFVQPTFPGPLVIPQGTTGPMATVLREQHVEDVRIFRETTGVEKALKQQIVKAVEQQWLLPITNRHSQSLTGTIAQILEFLFDTYGYVSTSMLENKENEFREMDYHPRQPVDIIFNIIEDLVDYAEMANAPYSENQTIAMAYSKFNKTGLLSNAITEWNRKPSVQKTWITLKTHFRQARKELKETSGHTIGSSQLHETANLVQQVVDGVQLALLPPEGMQDPATDILQQVVNSVSATSSTQQQLLTQIANLQQSVTQMQFQFNASYQQPPIIDTSGGRGRGTGRGGGSQGRGRGGRGANRYPRRYNSYCWSHGGCGHLGNTCRDKKPGHQDAATFENKMGGTAAYCPPGNVAPAEGWTPPDATA